MNKTIDLDDWFVEYQDSHEIRDQVFNKLIGWFTEHQSFCGESIMQSDDPQIYAPVVLSEIADEIIKFEYKDG